MCVCVCVCVRGDEEDEDVKKEARHLKKNSLSKAGYLWGDLQLITEERL